MKKQQKSKEMKYIWKVCGEKAAVRRHFIFYLFTKNPRCRLIHSYVMLLIITPVMKSKYKEFSCGKHNHSF